MAESSVAAGQQILPLIEHLARISRRAADAAMADGSLRPRHVIALTLLSERGSMTQHAVGAALSLDPSNVVGLLNELEERGLITRRRDPADRRRHIVEVSATGADELTQTYAQLGLVEDELFKTLTCEQRSTLHELLASAVAGLSPSHQSPESGCQGAGSDCDEPAAARIAADRASLALDPGCLEPDPGRLGPDPSEHG
jgi:MarR family transcriptional regulator, lower aerobic nicotinate degradation pathway regulator